MDLEQEMTVIRNLRSEMREIKQQIDREKNSAKKVKMIKAYRTMSKALSGKAH